MSIADKLLTIANNTPKVCGSLYTQKTVSGNSVAIRDVSPIEHNLGVRVTTGNSIDFDEIAVSRYGKNIFDVQSAKQFSGYSKVVELGEGYVAVSQTGKSTWFSKNFLLPNSISGKTVTISAKAKTSGENLACIRISRITSSGGIKGTDFVSNSVSSENEVLLSKTNLVTPLDEGDKGYVLLFYSNSSNSSLDANTTYEAYYSDIQVEISDTPTEYEPYKESQTATANIDGIVEGLKSLSPNMTLLTDTDDVIIECTYRSNDNPTANEKFIELQNAFASVKEIIQNQSGG